MLRLLQLGIFFHNARSGSAGPFHQGTVVHQAGKFVLHHPRLARAHEVAWSAQLQVYVGNFESVVGADHGFDAGQSVVAELRRGHQYAVGLLGAPAYASAQLVQLA